MRCDARTCQVFNGITEAVRPRSTMRRVCNELETLIHIEREHDEVLPTSAIEYLGARR